MMRTTGGAMKDEIAKALKVGSATGCAGKGVEAALGRREQLNRRQKKLDGSGEAHLIALACGEPPEGRAGWTLKLLAEGLVELEVKAGDGAPDAEKNSSPGGNAGASLPKGTPSVRHGRRAGGGITETRKSWCVWTRPASSWYRPARPARRAPGLPGPTIGISAQRGE